MKKIVNGIIIPLILSALISCGDFMDTHKEYIEDGEIIYAPKVASVIFFAGMNRIECQYMLYKSPNVRSVDLYWNEGMDSLIMPVTPTAGIDLFSVIIPNLEEKSYTFNARTTDLHGHKSLYLTNFGTSYGEVYKSTLTGRRVNTVELIDKNDIGTGSISLFAASEDLVRTEIRYQKSDGSTDIVVAKQNENTVFCPDALPGSTFEARSLYIPEPVAIDTFATAWTTYGTAFATSYQYDRSDWEVLEVSDETAGEGGSALIDGNLATYWSSQRTPVAPLPHWAIIDMKSPKNIVRFDIYRRSGNTDTRTVECYLGDSPEETGSWILIGEGTFTTGGRLEIESTDKLTRGRYLKIKLPDSNRAPYTNLAEVYPYGGL